MKFSSTTIELIRVTARKIAFFFDAYFGWYFVNGQKQQRWIKSLRSSYPEFEEM